MTKQLLLIFCLLSTTTLTVAEPPVRKTSAPPVITSSWDDLLQGIKDQADWHAHRKVLKQRYLNLLRDQHKPQKPTLDLKIHESVVVDGR